ncbi:hypothetical protein BH10BAC5_BH10BAC5_24430 [soil metagenome]
MKKLILKSWKHPVWSAVYAGIILIVLNAIYSKIEGISIIDNLLFEIKIKVFVLLMSIIIIFALILFLTNKSAAISKQQKKKLPEKFELEVVNYSVIELTAYMKRKWLPNIQERPDVETFVNNILFSEIRCSKCHSNFYLINKGKYEITEYFNCPTRECKFEIANYDAQHTEKQIIAAFKGKIRSDYNTYWRKYKQIYLDLTNEHPENYEDPI